MHISTSAVDLVEAHEEPSSQYPYGRGLAPLCLNRQTYGFSTNPNFWTYGLNFGNISMSSAAWILAPTNWSDFSATCLDLSGTHTTLNVVDDNGISQLTCEVWDLNYTVLKGGVISVAKSQSNGSTAGIASFPMSELVQFGYVLSLTLSLGAYALVKSPESFRIRASRGMAPPASHAS